MPTDTLAQDILISLAREHLSGLMGVWIAPEIPERKVRRARGAHALHLQADEPVVVLYDSTLFGGGDEGFIVTPAQLCWRNFLEHPRRIAWAELAHAPIHALDRRVEIARGQVQAPWDQDGAARLCAFLVACGKHTLSRAAPYRERARERDTDTIPEWIVRGARRAFGELDWIHYTPSIPPKMVATARLVHEKHLSPDEEILVLYDDTVFGSGSDGIVFTERAFYWRNFWGPAEVITWNELDMDLVIADGDLLFVDGDPALASRRRIDLRMRPGMARVVGGALKDLARTARRPA